MLTGRPRYDQIRNLYVSQLASVWIEDPTETIRASFNKKIDSFAEGRFEHVTEMLSTMWDILNKSGDITVPSTKSVPPLPSLVLRGDAHSTPQVGSCGLESRQLDGYEDRPHQVDSRRVFLRQEVLG